MAKRFPLHPSHPERICWGCDTYCAADDLACGNGSSRTQHPAELLGADWYEVGDWGLARLPAKSAVQAAPRTGFSERAPDGGPDRDE